eukprot:COSAG02_NODE_5006_length_4726_cov_21.452021_4_plen_120_part_00
MPARATCPLLTAGLRQWRPKGQPDCRRGYLAEERRGCASPAQRDPLLKGQTQLRCRGERAGQRKGNAVVSGLARTVNAFGRLVGADEEDMINLDEESRDFRREVRKKVMDERLVDKRHR